jgi:hypothetical protein
MTNSGTRRGAARSTKRAQIMFAKLYPRACPGINPAAVFGSTFSARWNLRRGKKPAAPLTKAARP